MQPEARTDCPPARPRRAASSIARALAAVAASSFASTALAQSGADDGAALIEQAAAEMRTRAEAEAASARLTALALDAFARSDYADAERLLLEQREIDGDNFVVHYNLACARAALGSIDEANADLRRAVELGFANLRHLLADAYLAPLRDTPAFRALVDNWDRVLDLQREARLDHARSWVRTASEERRDESLRIDVLSAHGAVETDRAMTEIERVAAWAGGALPGFDAAGESPHVVVALPDRQDFLKWAFWTYGQRARQALSGIGGAYEHDLKRLVAQDLGPTLRHEFFHVLHWRDMDRRGQIHPIWIQEGLASLVEDMDPARMLSRAPHTVAERPARPTRRIDPRLIPGDPESPTDVRTPTEIDSDRAAGRAESRRRAIEGFAPVPSWRTNIVKRLVERGGLIEPRDLAAMDHRTFSTQRPLATYACARSVFLFLVERDALGDWYRLYTADPSVGFDADPSGLEAMAATLGVTVGEFEDLHRDWVAAVPEVPETGADLRARLGVEIEPGEGDGPIVSRLPPGARRRTGLRVRDVITAVDGRPVGDIRELIRVLSAYAPGETVSVGYRRFRLNGETSVTLVPR